MEKIHTLLRRLKKRGYWANRVARQLEFAHSLIKAINTLDNGPYKEASSLVISHFNEEQTITKEIALKTEEVLSYYKEEAKRFTIHAVGHAHIDMNWMWGMHETVAIVLDTFRTMLQLMDEYPHFTFSQSQGATYKIVQEFEPKMVDEIKKRIKEGRWELTSTAWTEFDKNMSSTESHYHHYTHSKEYMKKLFDVENLKVAFEPDTFGHNQFLPDILSRMGLPYYYHCRGEVDHTLYRWRGPAGGEILVFKEPTWYLGPAVSPLNDPSLGTLTALEMDMAKEVIEIYNTYSLRHTLQVYGVGDHGGGPTRLDIEGLIDMMSWPCYPAIEFSTYHRFFDEIAPFKENFPLVEKEVNKIFSGCYTSQADLKKGNSKSEFALYRSSALSSFSFLATSKRGGDTSKRLDLVKEKVLFNQFHDILPGSCTHDAKLYSLGMYQDVYATTNTILSESLRNITQMIDTSRFGRPSSTVGARGGSGGFGYNATNVENSPFGSAEGVNRVITLFNDTSAYRDEVVEIILWDWEAPDAQIRCVDESGNQIELLIEQPQSLYWQHSALKVLVPITLKPFSYKSFLLTSDESSPLEPLPEIVNPRKESERVYLLENSFIRAQFSSDTMQLISLINKESSEEMLSSASGFLYLQEDASEEMTSWRVGREQQLIGAPKTISDVTHSSNALRQTLSYSMKIMNSNLKVTYTLDNNSKKIKVSTSIVWREMGDALLTPQLSYQLNLKSTEESFRYSSPYGVVVREAVNQHMPSLGWISRKTEEGVIQLSTKGKYGFVGDKGEMRVILLRSSSDPDPFAEVGEHQEEFSITLYNNREVTNKELLLNHQEFNMGVLQVVHTPHEGTLPLNYSFMSIEGPFIVTAIEEAKDSNLVEIRGFETEGEEGKLLLSLSDGSTIFGYGEIGKETLSVEKERELEITLKPYTPYRIIIGKEER